MEDRNKKDKSFITTCSSLAFKKHLVEKCLALGLKDLVIRSGDSMEHSHNS